ncbi:TIGR01458 family HAD-type hydrolase [Halioxenophilus sp. WMMB6]|uniref:TIGR01458 family HAD-type hydrolase n=1 Tax=Halioxenophilus sp. WMMB6 TaxID=3073815 RepID=UPI00295E314C|nr:TIGR01458 family HAD-type hydrolase [Halioxenophilus sp. WMMB6]
MVAQKIIDRPWLVSFNDRSYAEVFMTLNYRALLLDLSGVLYEGSRLLPGAVEAIAEARARGLLLRFVTNTATKPAVTIRADLAAMGIEVAAEELFTAPMAAKAYMEQHGLRPYCLLHPALAAEFAHLPQSNPNCVLLGDAREALTYDNLNHAFQLCKAGAALIGIGMNKYFKDEEGLKLDAGGFIRLVAWAADTPAVIMGKPSPDFFAQVVASTPCPAAECLMVGDDVDSDVLGAIAAGLQGCLVQTGKYQAGDEAKLPAPARLVASVAELFVAE